jgi:hypothetical protein
MTAGNLWAWTVVVNLWRTSWQFVMTPTHFIAVHQLRRERAEIPWAAITAVRKIPRSWWNGPGGIGFSVIESVEGHSIPVGTYLPKYKLFLSEIKTRATNCGTFDPYRNEWDRYRSPAPR